MEGQAEGSVWPSDGERFTSPASVAVEVCSGGRVVDVAAESRPSSRKRGRSAVRCEENRDAAIRECFSVGQQNAVLLHLYSEHAALC